MLLIRGVASLGGGGGRKAGVIILTITQRVGLLFAVQCTPRRRPTPIGIMGRRLYLTRYFDDRLEQ